MMMLAQLQILSILLSYGAYSLPQQIAQSKPAIQNFKLLLDEASLTFSMPSDFKEVPVVDNEDVIYHYAIAADKVKLQIRYVVRPLKKDIEKYAKAGRQGADPNAFFAPLLQVMCLNISGGSLATPTDFKTQDVKNEFGADAGRTAFVTLNSGFGKGYKACLVNVIHLNDTADAFIFYLFDDIAKVQSYCFRDDVFHALKFK
jgi:hypothetical protein